MPDRRTEDSRVEAKPGVIEFLNRALTTELTAINQYFVQAEMCKNWGYERLYEKLRATSLEEMEDTQELIARILYLDGVPKRGLILHHRRSEQFQKGEPPPRLSAEMLARIDAALSGQQSAGRSSMEGGKALPAILLGEYIDPLSGNSKQKYWGAVERVILNQPGGGRIDTGWLVLVQEPVRR